MPNAQQPNVFEWRAFSPFNTVSGCRAFRHCSSVFLSGVSRVYLSNTQPRKFFGVIKACICCGAIYDLENSVIGWYTHFSNKIRIDKKKLAQQNAVPLRISICTCVNVYANFSLIHDLCRIHEGCINHQTMIHLLISFYLLEWQNSMQICFDTYPVQR